MDQDYISQQFSKAANREYATTYYTDTQNFKLLNQLIEEESQLSNSNIKYLRMNGENIENLYYKIILHPELKLDIK